jgi:DNA modification methylase
MTFETLDIPIKSLKRNTGQIPGVPKNPRIIKDNNFKKLKDSIVQDPEMLELREIIAYKQGDDYIIIGGNMRFEALKALNFEKAKCKVITGETTPEQLKRIILKDNSAYGEWDFDELANEWEEALLNACAIDIPTIDEPKLEDEAEEDEFDETKETIPARCSKGDIWQLGDHRLMCGDSTNAADVALLMDGKRADICFTSPPYNVMAEFANKHIKDESAYLKNDTYEEYSDDLTDEQYYEFLQNALNNALNNADDVMFNIGCCKGALYGTAKMIGSNAEYFKGIIVWEKSGAFMPFFPAQYGLLGNIAEPIYCFSLSKKRKFAHPQWQKGEAVYNSVATANAAANEYNDVNAATFPIDLAAHFVKNFAAVSVLDLFGGTGTTLIAAEQLKKQCFMMELSAKECDIILARWEKLTGKQAVKLINQTE